MTRGVLRDSPNPAPWNYMRLVDTRTMADQQYEYHVEPISISPSELRDERYKLNELLNELAGEGWVLEDTLCITSSSLLFFFRRPIDS